MKRISTLAINKEGFVFDPLSGESFTANETAQFILKRMISNDPLERIIHKMRKQFKIDQSNAERDLDDFFNQLKIYQLLSQDYGKETT